MGRRGPPKKPTRFKILEGNPGKRPIHADPPAIPLMQDPRVPRWLSAPARAHWRWVVPQLRGMGVLTGVDLAALSLYCDAWARLMSALEFLAKHGHTYPVRDAKDRIIGFQKFPQVAIARDLLTIVRNFQRDFGMTPSARAGIEVSGFASSDADADFA